MLRRVFLRRGPGRAPTTGRRGERTRGCGTAVGGGVPPPTIVPSAVAAATSAGRLRRRPLLRPVASRPSSSSIFRPAAVRAGRFAGPAHHPRRCLSVEAEGEIELEPRESMPYDVVIVGGGPAGLAAAVRLKQLSNREGGTDLSVCVLEKGSEIGSHILSGNVFDPKALEELLSHDGDGDDGGGGTDWIEGLRESQDSVATPVTEDAFLVLTESGGSYRVPNALLPSQLHNDGNYILSLSKLSRYLGEMAENLGVEIYPGFAADEVLYDDGDGGGTGGVRGIATKDVGIAKDGSRKDTYERGVELLGRQTLFAEGARGSCTEELLSRFDLRGRAGAHPQRYGLGIKEVWEVPTREEGNDAFRPGFVQHTLGYPLQSSPFDAVYGGSFLYHQEPNLVLCGLVVGLDYQNPYLNPYAEFQRWKTHPAIKRHLEGGTCVQYGARVLNEGGYHSLPRITFPGGMLLGCAAGFLNAVKIKGSHCAIKSGVVAAESAYEALAGGGERGIGNGADDGGERAIAPAAVAATGEIPPDEPPAEVERYGSAMEASWVYDELREVRNCHAAFEKWGVGGGLVYTGLAAHVLKGREPWTLSAPKGCDTDALSTKPEKEFKPIEYPAPDGVITFDLLTNLQRSGTYHEDDQPSHLRIKPNLERVPESISLQVYAAPESRFCPAGVYEYVEEKLVINAQNCVHCKCCSIKMPHEYIHWAVPEGGGGPQYQVM